MSDANTNSGDLAAALARLGSATVGESGGLAADRRLRPAWLGASGQPLSRAALEAIALEGYRERKLTAAQLRRMLGYQSRMEVNGFLKDHGVELDYTIEDLERDRETHRRLRL